jgi:hypothetical protein
MARPRKYNATLTHIEEWRQGRGVTLKAGTVVRFVRSPDTIGVVGTPEYHPNTYSVRVYEGPNPWNNHVSVVRDHEVYEVDEPNPCVWSALDRYPGPANAEMRRLNESFARQAEEWRKTRNVEKDIEFIEEDLIRQKTLLSQADVADPVLDEDIEKSDIIDPDDDPTVLVDDIEIKRERITEEE